jgi:hypothetical protein
MTFVSVPASSKSVIGEVMPRRGVAHNLAQMEGRYRGLLEAALIADGLRSAADALGAR